VIKKSFFQYGFKAEPVRLFALQDGMLANFRSIAPLQDANEEAHLENEAFDFRDRLTNPVHKK
jgi:hypothetical protein